MMLFSLLWSGSIGAQTVEQDSIDMIENPQPTDDEYRVVTNRFWDNWFVLGSVGYHAFFGDYGKVEDFAGKLSPDFNVGVGKWFTPGIGVKLQFGMGNSRGYSKEPTPFTYGRCSLLEDEEQMVGFECQCYVQPVPSFLRIRRYRFRQADEPVYLFCGYRRFASQRYRSST